MRDYWQEVMITIQVMITMPEGGIDDGTAKDGRCSIVEGDKKTMKPPGDLYSNIF